MPMLRKWVGFKIFSLLPFGSRFYSYAQEHITKSIFASRLRVDQKLKVGLAYWNWLMQNDCADRVTENVVDLGAGWHPTIPLLWHAFGADRQVLLDVHPNMDARQVFDTARFFRELASESQWPGRAFLRRLPELQPVTTNDANEALKQIGIEYHAPYGKLLANQTGAFSAVVCTQALLHISKPVQIAIFKEIHHGLRSGGLFLATVHFVAQFRNPELRPGHYAHLRYSPAIWERCINSSLMSFNRLKGPDYRELLEQAGFRIREFKLTEPTPEDLAELKRTRVHPSFNRYSEPDLAARGVFFVAEKP